VTARFPDVPRTCALDFGCGIGRLTRPLAVHFARVIGVDVAESMIRRASELNSDVPNCEFVLNTRADLALFTSGSVDFVYSYIVLQHMERAYAERYIREFVRLLSPQGLAVFQVPSQRDWSLRGLLSRLIPGPLLQLYRRVRYGKLRIEMHAVPTRRVHAIVREAGGRIVEESRSTGSGWYSNWYYVRRSGAVA
jgi:ubiquinone/menaquinone biosynthesis C-methylase UbiE